MLITFLKESESSQNGILFFDKLDCFKIQIRSIYFTSKSDNDSYPAFATKNRNLMQKIINKGLKEDKNTDQLFINSNGLSLFLIFLQNCFLLNFFYLKVLVYCTQNSCLLQM